MGSILALRTFAGLPYGAEAPPWVFVRSVLGLSFAGAGDVWGCTLQLLAILSGTTGPDYARCVSVPAEGLLLALFLLGAVAFPSPPVAGL
eukprot:8345801-Alexandrium_andersonii.AAC.1